MAKAYYNEIEPYAAQWLRNLIDAGLIANGDVDTRSIVDVRASDLTGYTQCHFFAGIGVWSHALRQAGWPDDRPVWTGSCPCQPFSVAGASAGFDDERHLWPAWFSLIEKCRPVAFLGEQVEAAIRHSWLDLVQTDVEGIGYALGATCLPACGFGAPHIRQRIFFVGERMADAYENGCNSGNSVQPDGEEHDVEHGRSKAINRNLGNTLSAGLEGHSGDGNIERGSQPAGSTTSAGRTGGFWAECDWLPFRDSKIRPVEPGITPLANGTQSTVGRLRAYGNAIVAPVAAEFIKAYMTCINPA